MNALLWDEIEKNIEILIHNGTLQGKNIIIFGYNKPSQMIIVYLRNKGIYVKKIFDNSSEKIGMSYFGVKVYSPERCNDENTFILIASQFYNEMKEQLAGLGYKKEAVVQLMEFLPVTYNYGDFKESCSELYKGKSIYESLVDNYGSDVLIVLCPYNAIGDIYFFASYLDAFCDKNNIKEYVMIVVSNSCKRIAEMFKVPYIELLSQEDADAVMKLAAFIGQEKLRIKIMTHILIYWDIFKNFEGAHRIDWGMIFRCILIKTSNGKQKKIEYCKETERAADEFLKNNNIKQGKTAILAPYANTLMGLPDGIWEQIIKILKEKGYDIYTNSTGLKEPPLPGTKAVVFPLEIAKCVAEKAGLFIGVRSGICDIVEDSSGRVIIIYPDKKSLFFNLTSMGLGRNVSEVLFNPHSLENINNILDNL